jgi:hypothetical protein
MQCLLSTISHTKIKHTHVSIHIHIHTYTYTHTHRAKRRWTHAMSTTISHTKIKHTHVSILIHIHTYTYTHAHRAKRRWTHAMSTTISHTKIKHTHVSIHIHIHTYTHTHTQGKAAVDACNVYYYLTYENGVDLDSIADPVLRRATEAQIANFGQTPRRLFLQPHPRRRGVHEVFRPVFDTLLHSVDPNGSVAGNR